jgi:hypothetical protein
VKQKLSALAALGAAGSKWRQYWFCVTPDKSYALIALWCNGSTGVSKTLSLGSNPSGVTIKK